MAEFAYIVTLSTSEINEHDRHVGHMDILEMSQELGFLSNDFKIVGNAHLNVIGEQFSSCVHYISRMATNKC